MLISSLRKHLNVECIPGYIFRLYLTFRAFPNWVFIGFNSAYILELDLASEYLKLFELVVAFYLFEMNFKFLCCLSVMVYLTADDVYSQFL